MSAIVPLRREFAEALLTQRAAHTTPNSWLRFVRQSLGLSQKEFGGFVCYSANMMRKIEAGERRLAGNACERLADLLSCTPAERAELSVWLRNAQGW